MGERPVCIIDLPSHVGTPATWRSRSHPTMTVCDRHADQYAQAYEDDVRVDDWEPIQLEHLGRAERADG